MPDVFGGDAPILEGHEKALILLVFWVFFGFMIFAAMRQWEDWQEKKKIHDPYKDDNNLGSH